MRHSTRYVQFEAAPGDAHRPSATPIYLASTFEQPARFDYSRSGNPTRSVLEAQLASLEGGAGACCFASGLAAIHAVTRLLAAGDEILAGTELYGGTQRLLHGSLPRSGVTVRHADASDAEAFAAAIGPNTRLVLVETPTNPTLGIADIARLAELSHRAGALLCVDNTMLSPYLQNPLAHGADLVVHSATKFLGGHGDLVAGVVVARDEEIAARLAWIQNAEGAVLAPFDGYLLLRGIKTLALRLDRQQATAQRLARVLEEHPAVSRVHYPGLASHPGAALNARQARGPGAVISIETGSRTLSERFVGALSLFSLAVSFGSVHSTVSLPRAMSHASVPRSLPESVPAEDLVRLSIGIEDPDDIVEDVVRALDSVRYAPSRTTVARLDP